MNHDCDHVPLSLQLGKYSFTPYYDVEMDRLTQENVDLHRENTELRRRVNELERRLSIFDVQQIGPVESWVHRIARMVKR